MDSKLLSGTLGLMTLQVVSPIRPMDTRLRRKYCRGRTAISN